MHKDEIQSCMTHKNLRLLTVRKTIPPLFLLSALCILSACSTVKKDGPPPYNVDVSRIPDAVPKVEPLSKYGNKPYRVFGKWYPVMPSSHNYEEKGIASWYGTKFNARKTSSGERYDMLAMTAAHKSLPLPTYVQVTNLQNGKKIIVKVNDRGPFESNRLIDLSYTAAKKLGMLGHGTAWVKVKAINPYEYARNHHSQSIEWVKNSVSNGLSHLFSAETKTKVYLQIAAFKNKLHAVQLKNQLRYAGIGSPIAITQSASAEKMYRVQIGPIKDLATAKTITKRLKSSGLVNTPIIQYNSGV